MTHIYNQPTNEPTISDIAVMIWRGKIYVIAFALLGFITAFFWVSLSVKQYRASMLIAPAERTYAADVRSFLPETTSIAIQHLAQSIAPQDTTDFVRFYHILRRPSVAQRILDSGMDLEKIRMHQNFTFEPANNALENASSLSRYFEDHIRIESVGSTPLRRIIYDHPDPVFAATLLGALYGVTDQVIKDESRLNTENRIAYLQDSLRKVANPDHRRAIAALLTEQEHTKMILAMEGAFAATIAEAPSADVKPQSPKPILVYSICVLLGMFAGYMIYSLRSKITSTNAQIKTQTKTGA